ncbi:putative gpi-anchored protein [Phaeoacremonium minimum UCRPA7]|uniref:Putative gpi-anchored protein n=1 Tax=Phaeoacremonium minimum (strain UCR-PA7) TaxID=1286976 RepID=R8B9L9_PHAM7|nr:putative gpi-anchored protein [Phaeoacremonium minimum UCRPA7]EON96005.1 putative gpi-anchored protein [Phaeoacremonium minimum UCRPA7]
MANSRRLSDPTSNVDFTTLIEEQSIADLNPGHTCVTIPDAPSRVSAGDNATLQIIYRADWDAPHNQTFYACADITYIAAADFTTKIPCFNATEPGEDDIAATASPSASATSTSSPSTEGSNGSSGKGLSGGTIAGIVVGIVVGVALLLGAAFFLYRRNQRKNTRARLARMEDNARKHDWVGRHDSTSQNSVQLGNLPQN